jgi:hypothetical protein
MNECDGSGGVIFSMMAIFTHIYAIIEMVSRGTTLFVSGIGVNSYSIATQYADYGDTPGVHRHVPHL